MLLANGWEGSGSGMSAASWTSMKENDFDSWDGVRTPTGDLPGRDGPAGAVVLRRLLREELCRIGGVVRVLVPDGEEVYRGLEEDGEFHVDDCAEKGELALGVGKDASTMDCGKAEGSEPLVSVGGSSEALKVELGSNL